MTETKPPKPVWTIVVKNAEINSTGEILETLECYAAGSTLRVLASLEREYKSQLVKITAISPYGRHFTLAELRAELGHAPYDPTARSRAGKLGGAAAAALRSPEQRRSIAQRAALARWSKKKGK